MRALPRAVVTRHYMDDGFRPSLPAICVDWLHGGIDFTEQVWLLPRGVKLLGPAPVRFGIRLKAVSDDSLDVQLVWNNVHLRWSALTAAELTGCALSSLMKAMGIPLTELVAQELQPLPALAA